MPLTKSPGMSRGKRPPPRPGCRSRSTARLIYYSGSTRRTDGSAPHPSGPSAAREATRISPEHARTQPRRATGRLGARLRGGRLQIQVASAAITRTRLLPLRKRFDRRCLAKRGGRIQSKRGSAEARLAPEAGRTDPGV